MDIKELYGIAGGSYDEIKEIMLSDRLINKYVLKFKDLPLMDELDKNLRSKDYKTAFRTVHSLKGACQNIGFKGLQMSAVALTELLRPVGENEDNAELYYIDEERLEKLYTNIKEDYKIIIDAINDWAEIK